MSFPGLLIVAVAVLVFWTFVAWRVRVEGGIVHREPTALERLAKAFRDLHVALGTAFLPAVEEATRRMEEFVAHYRASMEASAEALSRSLALPAGYTARYETRPLLDPEGDTDS